jgi:hypothetical protein
MRFKSAVIVFSSASLLGGCGDEALIDPDTSPSSTLRGTERENIVVAGVGLASQPAILTVTVPVSSSIDVISARFRWVGRGSSPIGDDRILINGHQRPGTLLASYEVGGDAPWLHFYEWEAGALIRPGFNRFFVGGFDLVEPARADGIGIAVVYRDADSPWTSIATIDPQEFVSAGQGAVWELPIGASRDPRNGHFLMFAGDCTSNSTDRVWWNAGSGPAPVDLVGIAPNVLTDRLGSAQGTWMDVLSEEVTIPAFASHFAYQLESPADGTGDEIVHFFGALCTDGEITNCTGSVSGRAWEDLDHDGTEDAGEPGFSGVPVNLRDDLDLLVATTSTDEDGAFSFALLCAGNYVVEVDDSALPPGLEPTTCDFGDCSPRLVSLPADDSVIDRLAFGWAEPSSPATPCFWGVGFWKHEFDVATGAHGGRQHLERETLEALLTDVDRVTALDWTEGDGSLVFHDAAAILGRNGPSSCVKAEKHYFACLLNYAFSGSNPGIWVDTDQDGVTDMSFGELIGLVETLLAGGDPAECGAAKRMAASVNGMPSDDCPF